MTMLENRLSKGLAAEADARPLPTRLPQVSPTYSVKGARVALAAAAVTLVVVGGATLVSRVADPTNEVSVAAPGSSIGTTTTTQSTPTTSAASFEPSGNVIALIGIGEGLDASLTPIEVEGDGEVGASDFRSPVGAEYVELPFHELIRRVHADHPEVKMSDSMMTIMTEGLDGLDVTPFLYQLTERDGVMIENGYFDVPSLGVFVEISQQTFLADWDARHRPALEQEPGAVWQTGVEVPEDNDWIQIVAYSPAIEREVRIFFGQRTAATDDTAGFEFSVGEARELAQQILEAVAVPE